MNKNERFAISQFKRACEDLQMAVEYAKEYWPEAQLYLANDSLHLMKGESHSGIHQKPRHDNSLASVTIYGIGGGDW